MLAMAEGKEVPRCVYVIAKRGRRCRMEAAKDSEYCGEHLIHDKVCLVDSLVDMLHVSGVVDPLPSPSLCEGEGSGSMLNTNNLCS